MMGMTLTIVYGAGGGSRVYKVDMIFLSYGWRVEAERGHTSHLRSPSKEGVGQGLNERIPTGPCRVSASSRDSNADISHASRGKGEGLLFCRSL